MGIRCADHVTPLYPQKLALTSPTGGGRSVGIVRWRTKATELLYNSNWLIYITEKMHVCCAVWNSSSNTIHVDTGPYRVNAMDVSSYYILRADYPRVWDNSQCADDYCDAVWSHTCLSTFRKELLLPSSGCKTSLIWKRLMEGRIYSIRCYISTFRESYNFHITDRRDS